MTQVLSFPFRVDPHSGQAATVTVGSDREAAEAIAHLVLTIVGERDLAAGFGIIDPTGGEVDIAAQAQSGVSLYGPPGVTVGSDYITLDPDTGIADVALTFSVETEEEA